MKWAPTPWQQLGRTALFHPAPAAACGCRGFRARQTPQVPHASKTRPWAGFPRGERGRFSIGFSYGLDSGSYASPGSVRSKPSSIGSGSSSLGSSSSMARAWPSKAFARHGGKFANRASTCPRDHFCRRIIACRGQRRGRSSCRYQCRSRRSDQIFCSTWACSLKCAPASALVIGGAGTRPDHPKADIRRPLLSAVAHVRVRRLNGCLEDLQL
jgi:hypothetical protein